jgi:hypothetical protein
MATNRVQKRSAADSSNPLLEPGILQSMLGFVGPGHHLFVALVSKLWNDTYAVVESQQLTEHEEVGEQILTCATTTLHSFVFTSTSRVRLAHESGLDCTTQAYQSTAGSYADIGTLATAHELGMQYTAIIMLAAGRCSKLLEVQYLHSQGCPWPCGLLEAAAVMGDFELVRWCYEHGCPWDASRAAIYAAHSSNVELMSWVLQQPGTQLCMNVMCVAVWQSSAAMCQYLHTQHCPWSVTSSWHAANKGDVDLVRWLIDNGCPFHARELCMAAAQAGRTEVLDCLQQQGILESAEHLTASLSTAACYSQLPAAQWCREHGADWPATLSQREWCGELLQWARAEGCTSPII